MIWYDINVTSWHIYQNKGKSSKERQTATFWVKELITFEQTGLFRTSVSCQSTHVGFDYTEN